MTLEHKSPSQLEQMIAAAREKEKSAKAALYRDGQPMFLEEEHERQAKAIEALRRQGIDAVKREVQRRIQEIEAELLPTDTDPVTSLKGDDLTRASALAGFVREDIERGDFAPKLRAVLRRGDKAAQAVWLRYLSVPGERGLSRWDGEVQQMLKELEAIVRPADPRQGELQARQASLTSILMTEATKGYLERTYGRQATRTGRS